MTLKLKLSKPIFMKNQIEHNQKESVDLLRFLQKSAHHLKPVVQIGKNGINESVIKEINEALLAHELIKIKFLPSQKLYMQSLSEEIIQSTVSKLVKMQGNIITIFLAKKKNSNYLKGF